MANTMVRARRSDNEDWVYGYYVRLEDSLRKAIEGKGERVSHRIYTGFADSCVSNNGYDFSPEWYEIDPETIETINEE